jgi:hypothetical protein
VTNEPSARVYWGYPSGVEIPAELHFDGTSDYGYTQWSTPRPRIAAGAVLCLPDDWPPKHAVVVTPM